MTTHIASPSTTGRQRGFTMIELMVALLIGLFLMGGLMALLQNNRKAFSSQSQLGSFKTASAWP